MHGFRIRQCREHDFIGADASFGRIRDREIQNSLSRSARFLDRARESIRTEPPVCALGEHKLPVERPASPARATILPDGRDASLHQNLAIPISRKTPTVPARAGFWYSNTGVGLLARRRSSLAPPTPDCHTAPERCPASTDGSRAPSLSRTSRAVA